MLIIIAIYSATLVPICMAIRNVTILSIVPDIPIAPGLPYIGAALDLAVQRANAKYKDNLNVSLTKAQYVAGECPDFDSATLDFTAKESYRAKAAGSCIAVIGSGQSCSLPVIVFKKLIPYWSLWQVARWQQKF